jgi:metal-sulfur cluster biosynthetic enzyme
VILTDRGTGAGLRPDVGAAAVEPAAPGAVVGDPNWDPATAACWRALATVRDPELDEPITSLGFVADLSTEGRDDGYAVRARLRLPTFFCAPNFAWLMVADAADALRRVDSVRVVDVQLLDHFASAEINEGVAAAAGYASRFAVAGEPDDDPELAELRRVFEVKAHRAAQDRLARALATEGVAGEELVTLTLRESGRRAPEATAAMVRRRRAVGLDTGPDAPAIADDEGRPVPVDRLPMWLRVARATRVSIDGNGALCRGLLDTRYGQTRSMVEP